MLLLFFSATHTYDHITPDIKHTRSTAHAHAQFTRTFTYTRHTPHNTCIRVAQHTRHTTTTTRTRTHFYPPKKSHLWQQLHTLNAPCCAHAHAHTLHTHFTHSSHAQPLRLQPQPFARPPHAYLSLSRYRPRWPGGVFK